MAVGPFRQRSPTAHSAVYKVWAAEEYVGSISRPHGNRRWRLFDAPGVRSVCAGLEDCAIWLRTTTHRRGTVLLARTRDIRSAQSERPLSRSIVLRNGVKLQATTMAVPRTFCYRQRKRSDGKSRRSRTHGRSATCNDLPVSFLQSKQIGPIAETGNRH